MSVRTLRDVNIENCSFSMLTSLTSGIKLNHIKGPKNPIFVFNYSCMVRQRVLEALEDFSRDSELIKHEQKQQFFLLFQVHSIDPYGTFSVLKCIQKGYGTLVTLMEHDVEVKRRAWVPPFGCNNGDHFLSKSWGLRGIDGFFTSCFPFSCPRPPSKIQSHRVEHELGGKGQLTYFCVRLSQKTSKKRVFWGFPIRLQENPSQFCCSGPMMLALTG